MTNKILTHTYVAAGYTLSKSYTGLIIRPSATVAGQGVSAHFRTTIQNDGLVEASGSSTGVSLTAGGTLRNGRSGVVSGAYGVSIAGVPGSVLNYGSIVASTGLGVDLAKHGTIVNGDASDLTATIQGNGGVRVGGLAMVTNFGTIDGAGADHAGFGVYFGPGLVTNGSLTDTSAVIEGSGGVSNTGAGTLVNYGTVDGEGGEAARNCYTVINGAAADTSALIEGTLGLDGAVNVTNFGTIRGTRQGFGALDIANGAHIINGSVDDQTALIAGDLGVEMSTHSTLVNFGTVTGNLGVGIQVGIGLVTNGHAALIRGGGGILMYGYGTVNNLGTIDGTTGIGVAATAYNTVVNGGARDRSALIEGAQGVELSQGTLVNFGTIVGTSNVAVQFGSSINVLVVEAGCAFVGAVNGATGTLELATGVGTLSGLAGGSVTASGSMAPTTFTNFGKIEVDLPASFTLAGNNSITAGQTLVDAGTLTNAGTLSVAGSLITTGKLGGTGTLALTGGTASFNPATSLTVAKVTETGAATVATVGATNLTYAGVWTQTAGTLLVSAGDRINFSGVGDSFAGTLGGVGTVAFTGGSDTLTGTTLSATSAIINTATVTLQGAITLAHTLTATAANLIVAAGGATLTGGGTLALTNLATNRLYGTTASATLTNAGDRILGAGLLGNGRMTLINEAGGLIIGNDPTALTIDTGASTITNAGVIEATGAGGTTIMSAVNNTGTLGAANGNLTVSGAVTGAGTVHISGATAFFASSFSENVAFGGATGVLELAHSLTYTGSISSFSKTGGTALDLNDIAFGGSTKVTYSGTVSGGTLTVTDGAHTAHIALLGNYTTSNFQATSDGHGGTTVTDPANLSPKPREPLAALSSSLHHFAAAMAAGGVGAAAPVHASAFAPALHLLTSAAPRIACIA